MGDRIGVPDDGAFVVVGLLALAGAALVVAGAVRGATATVAVGGGALATSGAVLAALGGRRETSD